MVNESDSSNAINVVVDVVGRNITWPLDPNHPELPHLLDLKRRLDEARRKKQKERDPRPKKND